MLYEVITRWYITESDINKIHRKVDTLSYKTKSANKATVNKEWYVVDATNEVLGRLAAKVALVLRGKHKTSYTPHVDCGDNVIIINADKVRFTGDKLAQKEYIHYTGYPGVITSYSIHYTKLYEATEI